MEPESPSPYPQVPATCPYPEPTPSSPHDPLQLSEDPSSSYMSLFRLRLRDTSSRNTPPLLPRRSEWEVVYLRIVLSLEISTYG
jgi:hypothetical protein